jgi:hypothetical protein
VARAARPFSRLRERAADEVGRMRVYRLAVAATKAMWQEGRKAFTLN